MKFVKTTSFFLVVTIVLILAACAVPFGALFGVLAIGFVKGQRLITDLSDRCLDDIKRNIPSKS